ncbi:MAG: dienelactone hydrolase family protein, partial [Planctomycetales bacterium]
MVSHLNARLAISALFIRLAFGISFAVAQESPGELLSEADGVQKLQEIAVQTKQNYERLRTWTADWDGTLELFDEEQGQISRVRFQGVSILDPRSEQFVSDYDGPSEMELIDAGSQERQTKSIFPQRYLAVMTTDHLLYFDGGPLNGRVDGFPSIPWIRRAQGSRTVVLSPKTQLSKLDRWRVSDPRRFWQIESFFPWAFIDVFLKGANSEPVDPSALRTTIQVRRMAHPEGDEWHMRVLRSLPEGSPGRTPSTMEVIFDARKENQPTLWRQSIEGEGVTWEQQFAWKVKDGVYVPDRYQDALYGANRAGAENPVAKLSIQATDSTVNMPLDPHEFEIDQFALRYSDRVYDTQRSSVEVFNGETLVPLGDFEYRPPERGNKQSATIKPLITDTEGLVTERVSIPAKGFEIPAYTARPEKGREWPLIVVIHDHYGDAEFFRGVCRRFAKAGFLAVLPDLYARKMDAETRRLSDVPRMLKIATEIQPN